MTGLAERAVVGTSKSLDQAASACERVGLRPLHHPLGNGHHCDVNFTDQDVEIGDALAYFMGTLFSDVEGGPEARYWYYERTSVDEWSRVARALRVHGLAICNRDTKVAEQ